MILDGSGSPKTILETTAVEVVPFDEVTPDHAYAEGEEERMLASWRRIHRYFYERFVAPDVPFRDDMPIVCQRFRVVYPQPGHLHPIPR